MILLYIVVQHKTTAYYLHITSTLTSLNNHDNNTISMILCEIVYKKENNIHNIYNVDL
jgi:hypothetical protein